MKKYLIVYYGDVPECVEGFPKDCKRSCKGALHVKPGRQMTVTGDELKHLRECKLCSHMTSKLRVLGEKRDPKKEEKKVESKKSDAAEKPSTDSEETATQEEGTQRKKKKRR